MNSPRSITEIEERLAEVAKLDRRGWNQYDIAKKVGVSQACVSLDLKKIRSRYKDEMMSAHDEMIAQTVAEYKEIIRELWDAWERSKEDSMRKVEESIPVEIEDGDEEVEITVSARKPKKPKFKRVDLERLLEPRRFEFKKIKEVLTREGRLPASEYVRLILQAREGIRELLGLDAAKKVDMDLLAKVVPWEVLSLEADMPTVDLIEERIMEDL